VFVTEVIVKGAFMAYSDAEYQILASVEESLNKKTLAEVSISEVARKAGVSESVIYHYFKNKEDLLFSLVGIHMEKVLAKLNEHLEGIPDPVSKLSKMIWFHLHYNETHMKYSRVLLFECRSNRNFYRHKTYRLIKNYATVMLSILQEGVELGLFRDDLDIRLARDVILGGLDWETLGFLATENFLPSSSDLVEIMEFVSRMLAKPQRGQNFLGNKGMRILLAAEKLFAEQGYRGTRISEIARLSGVAEGTVYEYFESKENLLFSIPTMRFKEHIQSLDEIFQIKTPLRKLRRFIRYHFNLYMARPEFLKTFLLDIQLNPKFYKHDSLAFFREYTGYVDKILEEGKKQGDISPSLDERVFKNFFFGGFCHVALRWVILNSDLKIDKMIESNQLVELLLSGVSNS
jgi:TetR/AcrR family fatty acid metabolism transcriptional regulator